MLKSRIIINRLVEAIMIRINLKDRVSLVTGSSRGIGRGFATALAENGSDVIINYLKENEEDAYDTKQQVEKYGNRCEIIECDVSNEYEVGKYGKIMLNLNMEGLIY